MAFHVMPSADHAPLPPFVPPTATNFPLPHAMDLMVVVPNVVFAIGVHVKPSADHAAFPFEPPAMNLPFP